MVGSLVDLVKDFVVTRFEGVFMPGAAAELLGACVVDSMNGDDESRGTEKKRKKKDRILTVAPIINFTLIPALWQTVMKTSDTAKYKYKSSNISYRSERDLRSCEVT